MFKVTGPSLTGLDRRAPKGLATGTNPPPVVPPGPAESLVPVCGLFIFNVEPSPLQDSSGVRQKGGLPGESLRHVGCYSTIVGAEAGKRMVMRSPCRGRRPRPPVMDRSF